MSQRKEYQQNYYNSNKSAKQLVVSYEELIIKLRAEILLCKFDLSLQIQNNEKLAKENERMKLVMQYFAKE